MTERQQCRACGHGVAIATAASLCGGCAKASGFRRPLPAGFFTRPAMRSALSEHNFGMVFAAIRECTGLSQTQLAALLGLSQARVSEVEAGVRRLTGAKPVARISMRRPKDARAFCRLAAATSAGRRHPVSPITTGYIYTVTAWCWATLGEPEPTRRALADSAAGYAHVSESTAPAWAWVVTDAEIAAQQGHALYLLSLKHGEFGEPAAAKLTVAVEGHPAEHERSRAVVLPTLAAAHFRAGDIDAAVRIGQSAVTAVTALSSQRCYARLLDLGTVAARHRSVPEVRDLRADIAAAPAG